MALQPARRKLKILCLHGYRQDANAFKEKLGGFRKSVKNVAELVFITAPHVVPPANAHQNNVTTQATDASGTPAECGWWFSRPDDTFVADESTDVCKGFHESLDCVKNAFVQLGPFDGILGFSQGAALAAIVCALRELQEFPHPFHFAILIAGFKSRSSPHDAYFAGNKIRTPTLHVIGETDRVIPKAMSEELLEYFESPKTLLHAGGHYVPSNAAFRTSYVDFLNGALRSTEAFIDK